MEEKESPPEVPDKVCTPCLELNLTQDGIIDKFQTCPTCNELFCLHGASRLDPQCCIKCCNDFKVVDVEESITRDTHNSIGEITSTKQFRVRHITLSGFDWLFYNRAINSLSDLELDHAIEYHHAIFNGMLAERDARRVAHFRRNQGKRAGNESKSLLEGTASDPLIQTSGGAQFVVGKTTRTTRVKTVKTTESGPDSDKTAAKAAIQALLNAGMTREQIAAVFGKK